MFEPMHGNAVRDIVNLYGNQTILILKIKMNRSKTVAVSVLDDVSPL
jgi:hypothetical protein